MYVWGFFVLATSFNLELWNNHSLCKCLKRVFFKFLKIVFLQRYCPFSIFLKDLSVNLNSNYSQRNEILFVWKLIGQRQKFTGNIFPQVARCFACLSIILSRGLIIPTQAMKFIIIIRYVLIFKKPFLKIFWKSYF